MRTPHRSSCTHHQSVYAPNPEPVTRFRPLPLPDTLLYKKLLRRGYIVRTLTAFRIPGWIRVSLQPEPLMAGFRQAFASLFAEPPR